MCIRDSYYSPRHLYSVNIIMLLYLVYCISVQRFLLCNIFFLTFTNVFYDCSVFDEGYPVFPSKWRLWSLITLCEYFILLTILYLFQRLVSSVAWCFIININIKLTATSTTIYHFSICPQDSGDLFLSLTNYFVSYWSITKVSLMKLPVFDRIVFK